MAQAFTTKTRQKHQDDADAVDSAHVPPKQGEELKAELDDLLAAVDEALEIDAEDFVRSYVQKGGQ